MLLVLVFVLMAIINDTANPLEWHFIAQLLSAFLTMGIMFMTDDLFEQEYYDECDDYDDMAL